MKVNFTADVTVDIVDHQGEMYQRYFTRGTTLEVEDAIEVGSSFCNIYLPNRDVMVDIAMKNVTIVK